MGMKLGLGDGKYQHVMVFAISQIMSLIGRVQSFSHKRRKKEYKFIV